MENLLQAWGEFLVGKRSRDDIQEFQVHLMTNLISLHRDLVGGTYRHSDYDAFTVTDPKLRQIHKASVRDRVLHHALYRKLYPYFDRGFIAESFSCRNGKGTHLAMDRYRTFVCQESLNHSRTCWVLKCDIRKFFASIDQDILLAIIDQNVADKRITSLIAIIVRSFPTGLPLGNLTSQLLANVYMNEFDHFVKHQLRVKFYIRYADDFVFLHREKQYLECLLPVIDDFLCARLKLQLHPDKVFIKSAASGVDFLGWVHFSDYRILRTATKKRMMRNISETSRASYLGLCSHGNAERITSRFPHLNP